MEMPDRRRWTKTKGLTALGGSTRVRRLGFGSVDDRFAARPHFLKRFAELYRTKHPGRAARILTRFGRDQCGATMLEFALVSAPFFALLIAILETSLAFFAQQGLETTGEYASRIIMTGQAQTSAMSQSQFKSMVCQKLPPYLTCANLMVDVQTADSFDSVNTSSPTLSYKNGGVNNTWSFAPGSAGNIVIVRLMYLWPISKGPLGFDLSNQTGSNRLLISTSVAQTEPYPS